MCVKWKDSAITWKQDVIPMETECKIHVIRNARASGDRICKVVPPCVILPCRELLTRLRLDAKRQNYFYSREEAVAMPTRKKFIKAYVDDDEFDRISDLANRTGLTMSTYAKRLCLGHEVKSLEHAHVRNELRLLRGDLGRIGGLIKQLLAHQIVDKHRVHQELSKLDALQKKIDHTVELCS